MSETITVKVLSVAGPMAKLRVTLRQRDVQPFCISPAFFLSQLQESTAWNGAPQNQVAQELGERWSELGFHVWGDEIDDRRVAKLNKLAMTYLEAVVLGELENGTVVAKGRHVWLVSDLGKKSMPSLDVEVTVKDPTSLAHLKRGHEWGTSPPNFGLCPSAKR